MSIFIPPKITSDKLSSLTLLSGEIVYNQTDNIFYTGNGQAGGTPLYTNIPVPTKTSQLENDSGFITSAQTEIDPVFTANSGLFELKSEAFDGNYQSLSNKPSIPSKTSDLTNDNGFISSYTETDPVFTANSGLFELKAEAFDGNYQSLSNKPTIPLSTSQLTNDSGFITGYTETDPIFTANSGLFELKSEAFSGNYQDLINKPQNITTQGNTFNVASSLVQLNENAKIPVELFRSNKQNIFVDSTAITGTFELDFNPEYDVFINEITLSSNTLDIGQVKYNTYTLANNETATFENWINTTNNENINTVSINSNITIVDEIPTSLSGTLTHVFVRRIYKDSTGTIHQAISYAYGF